ncbi:MAG: hypothetical protein H5U40_04060, partial [Polyangiaceae bacterium]|nr:hypothetical protein [Polyangiaceae bacterium]
MSRITDELDAGAPLPEEASLPVAVASGAVGTTTRVLASIVAGASAVDAVLDVLREGGIPASSAVRIVRFEVDEGARSFAGAIGSLGEGAIDWRPALEASLRGHEVFFPSDAGAEVLALGASLSGELAPAREDEEVTRVAACLAVARRAVAARPELLVEELAPDLLDGLLEEVEAEAPSAPILAPTGGFGIVATDRAGAICAATVAEPAAVPLIALRFGR